MPIQTISIQTSPRLLRGQASSKVWESSMGNKAWRKIELLSVISDFLRMSWKSKPWKLSQPEILVTLRKIYFYSFSANIPPKKILQLTMTASWDSFWFLRLSKMGNIINQITFVYSTEWHAVILLASFVTGDNLISPFNNLFVELENGPVFFKN